MDNKTTFEKVKELLYQRVESSLKAGRKMFPGAWADDEDGARCAVGAIAFNGDLAEDLVDDPYPNVEETYALAARHLRQVGVPVNEIGIILDAISGGFELQVFPGEDDPSGCPVVSYADDFLVHYALEDALAQEINWVDDWDLTIQEYKQYYDLGVEIREKYVRE